MTVGALGAIATGLGVVYGSKFQTVDIGNSHARDSQMCFVAQVPNLNSFSIVLKINKEAAGCH